MYLIATLELAYGGLAEFLPHRPTITKAMESQGIKLLHAMTPFSGRLNNLIHIWQIESVDAFYAARARLGQYPGMDQVRAMLRKVVIQETLVFADDAPL